jgi:hypothetical protein
MSSEKIIYTKMSTIMQECGAITKNRKNDHQGYMFRGIDDVYNMCHDICAKNQVFTTTKILSEKHEERQSKSGGLNIWRLYKIEYTFWAIDGSSVSTEVIGEGMDSGDKGSYKAMAGAQKYALIQALQIETNEKIDPEYDDVKIEKNKETMSEEVLELFIQNIEQSLTEDELKKRYFEAMDAAKSLNDKNAQNKIIIKKDYQKKRLQEVK